jgi:tetratricopeptide (TPR) repeat protein
VAGLAFLVLLIAVAYRYWWADDNKPAPPSRGPGQAIGAPDDPRLTFKTPYRNVHPDVQYVGDTVCAECHESIARTYREHPMGRSLVPLAAATPLERYTEAARNPFAVAGLRYGIERKGERAWHRESVRDTGGRVVAQTTAEVHFAVGSGRSGRAYLVDHGGYLFASPITWYPARGAWDLSPGYEKSNPHFDRPITPDCLFCHSNRADHVAHTVNRYRAPIFQGHAIGCERCHGPGQLHVARHKEGAAAAGLDDTIVNPARLGPSLREAVCQQCHLQGQLRIWRRGRDTFDYRPGLPFYLFMSEFVKPAQQGDALKFVGTVEQMHASRCYQKGAGRDRMGCISCHDPHAVPMKDKKDAFYRQRCLNCHKERGCSLPEAARRAKEDSCIACHMPKTGSNVNHAAITDHRILREPDRARPPDDGPVPRSMPLLHFHRDQVAGKDPEVERDLAIALVKLANSMREGGVARSWTEMALPMLESALKRDGEDLPAWEAKGSALWFQGRLEDANAVFEKVLHAAPDREHTLFLAGTLALRLRRVEEARGHAERLVKVNPWRWRHHLTLGEVHRQDDNWAAALKAYREALRLNPADLSTRQLVVLSHLRLGQQAEAQKEFDTLLPLNPPQPDVLRRWFAEEMLRAGR